MINYSIKGNLSTTIKFICSITEIMQLKSSLHDNVIIYKKS